MSGIIFNGEEIDTKMNIAGQFPMMAVTDGEEETALDFRFVSVDQSLKAWIAPQRFPNRIKF